MVPRLFLLVIILLKGIIGQQYILKSDSPNLDGSEVCPRNIRLICVGIEVFVLYWNATTTDGREFVLASHSGGQEDYQIETHFRGISYNITPDFVFPFEDRSLFNVNATIVIELSSIVKQNIIGFSCGSTSRTISSNLYSTNVTVLGQPPSPSITGCCHPSTSVSSDPITCSVLSNTEISFSWPQQYTSRYQIQRYRVVYDGRLGTPECLSSHFSSPNQTCNFSGLNDRTEYTFSISSLNCGDQESPTTNLTLSLAFLLDPTKIQGVIITPSYNNNLQLNEIMVQWNYLESRCPGIDYDYMIFLKNSSGFIIQNYTVSCDGVEICDSLLKVLLDYDYDMYIVEISAYYYFYSSAYYNVSYTSNPINGVSIIQPNISVEFLPCSVKCYSNSNGTCEIEIHYAQNSTILLNGTINGTVNVDNILVPELQSGIVNYSAIFYIGGSTFTLQDSSIFQCKMKQNLSNGALAGIIIAVSFILCFILGLIGLILFKKLRKNDPKSSKPKVDGLEVWQDENHVKKMRTDKMGMLVDEHGTRVVEQLISTSGHRHYGEGAVKARVRVAEEQTREAKKLMAEVEKAEVEKEETPHKSETELNVYSQTKHVGPSSNQKTKPKRGSNYSNMGKKPAVSPGDKHYAKLQHNNSASLPSAVSPPGVFTTTATTASGGSMPLSTPPGYSQVGTQPSELPPKVNRAANAGRGGSGMEEYGKLESQEKTKQESAARNGRRKAEEKNKKEENATTQET